MNEIIDGLFIGDYQDAVECPSDLVNINVAFEHLYTLPRAIYMPIMVPTSNGGARVLDQVLETVAQNIERNLKIGKRTLVNCNMGQERAPLTVVWFLMRMRKMTIQNAYALVRTKRPQTLDRSSWIEGWKPE